MARINIVQLQTALLLNLTAVFIEKKLGIPPKERQMRACFWDDTDYPAICDAIARHAKSCRDRNINAISGLRPKKDDAVVAAPDADPFLDEDAAPDATSNVDPFLDGDAAPSTEGGPGEPETTDDDDFFKDQP